jgi:hypothetical protein
MARESKENAPEAHKQVSKAVGKIYARFTKHAFLRVARSGDSRDGRGGYRPHPSLVNVCVAHVQLQLMPERRKKFSSLHEQRLFSSAICRMGTEVFPPHETSTSSLACVWQK